MNRRLCWAALVAIVSWAGIACGVPSEGSPRAISQEELPALLQGPEATTTTTTTIPGLSTTVERAVFVVKALPDDGLGLWKLDVPVQMPIDADPAEEARRRITALISERTESLSSRRSDLQNRVPLETSINGVELMGDVLVIDFSKQLTESITGEGLRLAIAQIVFTATDVVGVRSVLFRVDGVDQSVPVETTTKEAGQPVSPADFPKLDQTKGSTEATPAAGTG